MSTWFRWVWGGRLLKRGCLLTKPVPTAPGSSLPGVIGVVVIVVEKVGSLVVEAIVVVEQESFCRLLFFGLYRRWVRYPWEPRVAIGVALVIMNVASVVVSQVSWEKKCFFRVTWLDSITHSAPGHCLAHRRAFQPSPDCKYTPRVECKSHWHILDRFDTRYNPVEASRVDTNSLRGSCKSRWWHCIPLGNEEFHKSCRSSHLRICEDMKRNRLIINGLKRLLFPRNSATSSTTSLPKKSKFQKLGEKMIDGLGVQERSTWLAVPGTTCSMQHLDLTVFVLHSWLILLYKLEERGCVTHRHSIGFWQKPWTQSGNLTQTLQLSPVQPGWHLSQYIVWQASVFI